MRAQNEGGVTDTDGTLTSEVVYLSVPDGGLLINVKLQEMTIRNVGKPKRNQRKTNNDPWRSVKSMLSVVLTYIPEMEKLINALLISSRN